MYLIPLAAVALASCSNESVDSREQRTAANPGTALNIFPAVQGTTRGTVLTDANLQKFRVVASSTDGVFFSVPTGTSLSNPATSTTGYTSLTGSFEKTVELESASGKWVIESGKDYYWESKTMSGQFQAYAPYSEYSEDPGAFRPGSQYQVKNALADQEDIIVAYNEGKGGDFTSGVPLNFQHAMSQVIIKALNKDASTHRIEVAGIKLCNLKNTGTLADVTTPTTSGTFAWPAAAWTLGTPTDTYKDGKTTAKPTDGITTLTTSATQLHATPFLLMPQTTAKADLTAGTGAYFSVLIRVTKIDGSEQIYPTMSTPGELNVKDYFAYAAIPVDIDWKPGYKYTYTLNFSGTGIGKVDPKNPDSDTPGSTTGYPTGKPKGSDILDGPVQLFFTVTVEDWQDGGNSPLDM